VVTLDATREATATFNWPGPWIAVLEAADGDGQVGAVAFGAPPGIAWHPLGGSEGFESMLKVTVVDIRGDKVRLGINAPRDIMVHRKEVYEAIRRENRAAAQVKPEDLSGLGKISPKGPSKEDKK